MVLAPSRRKTRSGKPRNGARQECFPRSEPEAQERLPRCLEAHIAKSLRAYSYRATEATTTTTTIGQGAASSMTRRAGRAASALFKRQTPVSGSEHGSAQGSAGAQVDPHGHDDHRHTATLKPLLHHERGLVVKHPVPEGVFLENQLASDE